MDGTASEKAKHHDIDRHTIERVTKSMTQIGLTPLILTLLAVAAAFGVPAGIDRGNNRICTAWQPQDIRLMAEQDFPWWVFPVHAAFRHNRKPLRIHFDCKRLHCLLPALSDQNRSSTVNSTASGHFGLPPCQQAVRSFSSEKQFLEAP